MRRAMAFLTPVGGAATPSARALVWFPVVGALIGLAVGGVWSVGGRLWPPAVAAALALAADLALTGIYTTQGRGGTAFIRQNVFTGTGTSSQVTDILPGGFGDAFDQMFHFGYPIYGFGLRLRLPIKNRAASADMADAIVSKRRDALTVRGTEQQIRLDVLNAINQLESSKTSVDLAIKSRDFAKLALEAENKKYELGTSQIQFVLTAQNNLVVAESNVVSQSLGYRRNALTLLRVTGDLLEERGVAIK